MQGRFKMEYRLFTIVRYNYRDNTGERQVRQDLGYSQRPTVIHCDNEVVVGLAQKYAKQKLSKSCDMRLHWLLLSTYRHQHKTTYSIAPCIASVTRQYITGQYKHI